MKLVIVSQVQGRVPVTVLELQGRVNLGNAMELEQAALQAYNTGARDILIDLSKAPSLTSAGIRSILTIHKLLTNTGMDKVNHLKLVSSSAYVRNVLEVAGLLDYIEVFTSLEEAIPSY